MQLYQHLRKLEKKTKFSENTISRFSNSSRVDITVY